jgi:hypothetical protein
VVTINSKNLQVLHIILGLFFTLAGILTLTDLNYLFSIWIVSLGFLFLHDSIRDALKQKIKPVIFEILHYTLALIVLITGILTLLI